DLQDAMRQVEADVARLRKLIDAQAEAEAADAIELALPPEISVPRPSVVAAYVAKHPEMLDIVKDLAVSLVREFEHEPAQIELDVCVDDYIDERDLVFNVRVAKYDQSLM